MLRESALLVITGPSPPYHSSIILFCNTRLCSKKPASRWYLASNLYHLFESAALGGRKQKEKKAKEVISGATQKACLNCSERRLYSDIFPTQPPPNSNQCRPPPSPGDERPNERTITGRQGKQWQSGQHPGGSREQQHLASDTGTSDPGLSAREPQFKARRVA